MRNSQFLSMSKYIETDMYDMFICLCSAPGGGGEMDACNHVILIMIDLVLYKIKIETIGSLDNGTI